MVAVVVARRRSANGSEENVEYSFPPLDSSNTTDALRDQLRHYRITHLFYRYTTHVFEATV
jgi:hypothetical protein